MYRTDKCDTIGSELFAVGLAVLSELLSRLPDFGDVGPDDLDVMEQTKRYIFKAVRNRMLNHVRDIHPKWWRRSLCGGLIQNDECGREEWEALCRRDRTDESALATESTGPEADEAAYHRTRKAIAAACTKETDKELVELRERDLSHEEIGKALHRKPYQVQRDQARILRATEESLGLPHAKTKKRKSRKRFDPTLTATNREMGKSH